MIRYGRLLICANVLEIAVGLTELAATIEARILDAVIGEWRELSQLFFCLVCQIELGDPQLNFQTHFISQFLILHWFFMSVSKGPLSKFSSPVFNLTRDDFNATA